MFTKKYYLLLPVLVLLFLVLFTTSYFTLYNGDKWNSYRIGDVFKFDKNNIHYNEYYPNNINYHKERFPDSIASEYMKRNMSSNGNNLELLKQIIDEKSTEIYISDNTLVLHMRVGDVMCSFLPIFKEPYNKQNNVEWWDNVVQYIQTHKINKVVIIAGTHVDTCIRESDDYIKNRSQFLKNVTGVEIEYQIGKSPDDDIIYCRNAKHVISTGGGFGDILKLVSNMA